MTVRELIGELMASDIDLDDDIYVGGENAAHITEVVSRGDGCVWINGAPPLPGANTEQA